MNELINKLEQMGQTGSLKQCQLQQLLEQNDLKNSQIKQFLSLSEEYTCILLPDDDED